jgi:hypothetical protein
MDDQMKLPRDPFSTRLRELSNHPEAVQKQSVIDIADDYGNLTTWVVTSFRHDGHTTLFLQRNTAEGGERFVLPPQVTAAIARQRSGAVSVNRRKGAARGAVTRKAKGFVPTPPKRPDRQARAGQEKR